MNKKQNILVTGGAGYIGSHIVELLVKIKANIIEAQARKKVLKKVEEIILVTGIPVLTKEVLR